MPARHTIQDMRLWAADKGGKCLSKEYWNMNTKLTWMCSKGHTWDTMPISIYQGCWCPICSGKQKGTIEEMQELAIEREGKCLSKRYINNYLKLEWQCIKGHTWKSAAHPVKSGSWCPYCFGNAKRTLDQMRQIAKKRGGKCLSDRYVNKETKLKWKCAEGHIWQARPGSIIKTTWCPVCAKKQLGNKGKVHSIEEMNRIAKERKGKCLSKKYIDVDTPLKWKCTRGHIWKAIPYSVIHRGSWCRKCSYIEKRSKYKYHQ